MPSFSAKNFRRGGFFTLSHFLKILGILLLLKGKNVYCFFSSVLPEAYDFCFL
jgi:hypothetical protein